jgi:prepilin-type N-terminal cleavage/methylation domain-containing protein
MRNSAGFSLIEVAIAMVVISLLAMPAVEAYRIQEYEDKIDTTIGNNNAILSAIDNFYFANGRYPCPADPTLNENSANYGQEEQNGSATKCKNGGQFGNGVIRFGAVPFKAIKLPANYALDGWKNKISYAVTTTNADSSATFDPAGPAVDIEDYAPPPAAPFTIEPEQGGIVPGKAFYILVSHGPDGVGAYSASGVLVKPCPSPPVTADQENCNGDTVFLDVGDNDKGSQRSLAAGSAHYFDDVTKAQNSIASRIWTYSSVSPDDIWSEQNINLGIKNKNPQTKLDVGTQGANPPTGIIKANATASGQNGDLQANFYCDPQFTDPVTGNPSGNGVNCMGTHAIMGLVGSGEGISVGPNSAMKNIHNSQSEGISSVNATITGSCPPGEFVTGVTSGGMVCNP